MRIDAERVSEIIGHFLQRQVEQQGKQGIALGLSGGIDSAVIATLAAKALSPKKVYALYMFDQFSQKRFYRRARKLAEHLGIRFEDRDITTLVAQRKGYVAPVIRASGISSILNKAVVLLCRLIYPIILESSLFSVILEHGNTGRDSLRRTFYRSIARASEQSFNIRHLVRRELLQKYAEEKNLLPIGTANRSEFLIGWFVKEGIDNLPIAPLLGLYKTQVFTLARYLNIPAEIIKAPPSPDMAKGITDEIIIGCSYSKIDKVLYVMDNNLSEDLLLNEGINRKEFTRIKTFTELSAWKRSGQDQEFPVCIDSAANKS